MMESFHGKSMESHPPMLPTGTSYHHHPFHLCHHHHHHHPHPHHHHHHHHHHPSCTLKPHSALLHKHTLNPTCHIHLCPSFAHPPLPSTIPINPESDISVYIPGDMNLKVSDSKEDKGSEAQLLQEEFQEEEEDEEEPIYVMTDEWAEFFAKSEEKRRLEKKQAKKNKKNKGN